MATWGIDASLWNVDDYPLEDFRDHGCSFVIARAGGSGRDDPELQNHAARAARAGLPLWTYYWVDPILPGGPQLDHALTLMDKVGAAGLCPDLEQWWNDWEKWRKYQRKVLPKGAVPVVPAAKLSEHWAAFMEAAAARVSVVGYTARWVVEGYCRPMRAWMPRFDWWLAEYPSARLWSPSWSEFLARLAELATSFEAGRAPGRPEGLPAAAVVGWQVSDKWTLPGARKRLDINLAKPPAFAGQVEPRPVSWANLSEAQRWEVVRKHLRSAGDLDTQDRLVL